MGNKHSKKAASTALALLIALATIFGNAGIAFAVANDTSIEAPTLAVQSTAPGQITLAWDPVEGVIGYYIYRSESEETEPSLIGVHYDRNTLIYLDDKCEEGKGYFYTISSVYIKSFKIYESPHSSPIYATAAQQEEATVIAPMAAAESRAAGFEILPFAESEFEGKPSIKSGILTAVDAQSANSVQLTWNAMAGAEKYYICRSGSLMGTYEIVGETKNTSYVDTGCKPGTTYYYSLGAEKSNGKLLPDIPMPQSVKTPEVAAATPVPSVTVKPSSTPAATIKPTDAATGSPTLTEPVPDGTPSTEAPVQTPSPTQEVAPTVAPNTPKPATKLKITVKSPATVELSWTKSRDAEGYNIYRANVSGGEYTMIQSVGKDVLKYSDNNLETNATYYYYVTAVQLGVESAPTEIASAPVGSVVELTAAPYTKSTYVGVKLEWNKVPDAKKYNIYRSTDGANYTLLKNTSARTYDDKRVPGNTDLWYKVESDNGASAIKTVTSGSQELKLKISNTGGVSESAIKLSWNAIEGAAYYNVYRSLNNADYEHIAKVDAPGVAYIDTGLKQMTEYYYKVEASTGSVGINSKKTDSIKLVVSAMPAGFGSGRSIQLRWNAAPGATTYTIMRFTILGETVTLGETSELSFLDNQNLSPFTAYFYRIVADTGVEGMGTSPTLW